MQAALAKHKEEKMALPMPTKRRSAFVQSPIDTCTPPGKRFLTLSGQLSKWFPIRNPLMPCLRRSNKIITVSLSFRHIFCIRGWGLTAQKGSSQCSASPEPAEPRLLDQPLRPKLLHFLVCFLHPLPWRAQDPATAPTRCFPVGWRTGPHTHR